MLVPLPGDAFQGDNSQHFERARVSFTTVSVFIFSFLCTLALTLTLFLSLFKMQLLQRGEVRRHLEVFISRTFTYPNCQRATRVLRLLIAVTLCAGARGGSRLCGGINVLHTSFDIRVQPHSTPYPAQSQSQTQPQP